MKIDLMLLFETELYQLEDLPKAQFEALLSGNQIYTWKTVGRCNWLEQGVSIADTLGLVMLPRGLPETIDLPDDPLEPGDNVM